MLYIKRKKGNRRMDAILKLDNLQIEKKIINSLEGTNEVV